MGLSGVTVSIHPFRFEQEGGGQGGIRLKPRGCHHPSKKETQLELEKAAASLTDFFWKMGRRRVGVSVKLDAWPVPPMDTQSSDLCLREDSRPFCVSYLEDGQMGFAVVSLLCGQPARLPSTLSLFLCGWFCGSERGRGSLTSVPFESLHKAF